MKRLILCSLLALGVTAPATTADAAKAKKQESDVQKALKQAYPDAETEVTGTNEVNGVKVYDISVKTKKGQSTAQVTDYGVYNYRCIGGGTPPNCPNGISQHAYAMAIDLAGFTTSDGAYASVNDDWVIDPDAEETCEAPTVEGKDRFLHELICELKANDVWKIVLEPPRR